MRQPGHLRTRTDKNGEPHYQMIVEVWKNGIMHRKAKTFPTEEEAIKWGWKTRDEIETGHVSKESLRDRKLKEAIDKYIEEMLPAKSAADVERHLKWWKACIGNLTLPEVTPKLLTDLKNRLLKEPTHQGKKRANATVRYYISSLSCVFEAAIKDWFWTKENPVRLIRKPSISNARKDSLTPDECKRLLKACQESRNPYLYSIVALGIYTGMRKGEILGLRWKDIDFNTNQIHLSETKNGSSRDVVMISFIAQILKNMFEKEKVADFSYELFPRLNIRYLDIRTAWDFALKRANLKRPGIVFHTLRHTCESMLAAAGISEKERMVILGHKDKNSCHRYTHYTPEHLNNSLQRAFKDMIPSPLSNHKTYQ